MARVFAAEGWDLVITARREDRLRTLAEELARQHGRRVHVVVSDLAAQGAVATLCDEIAVRGLIVDGLVNNAGYGVPGTYVDSTWERHHAFLQVMVVAVAELTHRLLPGMLERRYGRILNVASLAGLVPAPPGHTLYAASKSFMIKFSEALSQEVREQGVHVTAVCPGFTVSEFHDVTGTRDIMKNLPAFMWMDSATVARQGFDAVMHGMPVVVTGRVNSTIATLVRILPQRILSVLGRRFSRSYRKV
jgi:short-subunit dehydrogenase